MYADLNPFVWRWLFLAGLMVLVAVGVVLVAIGQRLQKRALERRRAERGRGRSTHHHPVHAS